LNPPSSSTQSLTALACGFHESDDTTDPDRLAGWIREDAEMSLAMTHFKLVRGKRAIMDGLYRDRESVLYSGG
jgi:hypothetical protein